VCVILFFLDAKPKGTLNLLGCSVTETSPNTFVISSPQRPDLHFKTNDEHENKDWIDALSESILHDNTLIDLGIPKRGFMEKKGFHFFLFF